MWLWIALAVAAVLVAAVIAALARRESLRHQEEFVANRRDRDSALTRQKEEIAGQFEASQQALFNSMIEGILLLDRAGRIEMVNESLRKYFDVTTDIRGQTIMESVSMAFPNWRRWPLNFNETRRFPTRNWRFTAREGVSFRSTPRWLPIVLGPNRGNCSCSTKSPG